MALVSYYSPSIDTTLVSLEPYRPGMYEWEFRLSDSLRLRLDKDYTLRFRTGDKHANDITGRFRYEENWASSPSRPGPTNRNTHGTTR